MRDVAGKAAFISGAAGGRWHRSLRVSRAGVGDDDLHPVSATPSGTRTSLPSREDDGGQVRWGLMASLTRRLISRSCLACVLVRGSMRRRCTSATWPGAVAVTLSQPASVRVATG